ncbi:hypothetical protein E2320_019409 [Naja naja]|nr:hypothetical protein E2320_019409 [Naja naja]
MSALQNAALYCEFCDLDEILQDGSTEEIQTRKSNSLKTARQATKVHCEETKDIGGDEDADDTGTEPSKREEQRRGLFHCPHKPMTRGNNKPPIWKCSKQCDC